MRQQGVLTHCYIPSRHEGVTCQKTASFNKYLDQLFDYTLPTDDDDDDDKLQLGCRLVAVVISHVNKI
jgi:hypothetical protein